MVGGAGIVGIVGLGAVGGILANIALTPLTAGASLLQSYWYGSGLILGERMMYTVHWEKIKVRLDKGEDFLQVLDGVMNDDITAIANLSFKAMDETGKLYLDKAGTAIAAFVDKLLTAIITPFPPVNVETEPGPTGGTTETEPHSLSISEIQALSTSVLQQMLAFPDKWTEGTISHVKVEMLNRNIDEETTKETETEKALIFSGLIAEEIAYQSLLNVTTLSNVWQFLATLPSELQSLISSRITPLGYLGTSSARTEGVASNDLLKKYFDNFASTRQQWYDNSNSIQNFDLVLFQRNVFLWAFMIHVHQLVYSR